MKLTKITLFSILFFAFAVVGCDSAGSITDSLSDGTGDAPVSLSFSIADGSSLAAFNSGAPMLSKSTALELSRVRLLLRTIQFHSREDDTPSDFRTDPVVVELNLDGTATEVEVTEIPEGTYHKVSFRIHKPEDDEVLSEGMEDFRVGESGHERFSMIIEGMYNGEAFTYRSSKSMQQKIDLVPDLVVDGTFVGPLNVAMQVDVSQWFVDRNGNPLDPTNTSERNANAIDRSIRESFRAFPDRDHDRHRDHEDDDDDDDDDDTDDEDGEDDSDDAG